VRKANFFIIGAPKCGTTSMATYLKEHPNIFITEPKEPHYFNTDFDNRYTQTEKQYNDYFTEVKDCHSAVGEASVHYLYSKTAVSNILQYNPNSKFIVMLRNPILMAYSFHSEAIYSHGENVRDFSKAWSLQFERMNGNNIPKYCSDKKFLFYGDICKVGEQVSRLFEKVPRNRVLVILLDDFINDQVSCYNNLLSFLEVPFDGRVCFPVYNENKKLRSPMLSYFNHFLGSLKRSLRIQKGFGVLSAMSRMNTKIDKRTPLKDEFYLELADYFKKDVELLSKTLDLDLSKWFRK